MDPEVAQVVLAAITAVGAGVWLVALRFLINSARNVRAAQPQALAETDLAGEGHDGWLSGSAEVEGDASTLASRAAAILARGDPFTLGHVKILEKADYYVRFERAEAGVANRPAGYWFRRGELRFEEDLERAAAQARIALDNGVLERPANARHQARARVVSRHDPQQRGFAGFQRPQGVEPHR